MEKSGAERIIIPICILFCIAATVKGVLYGGSDLTTAIIISSIFFYFVLYSHDNRLDTLTGLLNRQAFYDDCAALGKNIKAVASLDMNGLKELNDSLGHQAGDEALKKIGQCLHSFMSRRMSAYRIGGDEFAILFFHDDEAEIAVFEKKVKEKLAKDGCSVSVGYAVCGRDRGLNETIAESDRMMYEDKARYYETSGRDRRKSRAPKAEDQ